MATAFLTVRNKKVAVLASWLAVGLLTLMVQYVLTPTVLFLTAFGVSVVTEVA